MNVRRTYAFAEDVGTLTVPDEKNVNANCSYASRRITRYATYPCNTSTFGAGESRSDIRVKIVATTGARERAWPGTIFESLPIVCAAQTSQTIKQYKYSSFDSSRAHPTPTMPTNNYTGESYQVTSSGTNSQVSAL